MANTQHPSELHLNTHKELTDLLEPYHEKLNELDQQIAKLGQQREVVRATLMHELGSHKLKLPSDAIGALAARCW